jgi:hypothetical protein
VSSVLNTRRAEDIPVSNQSQRFFRPAGSKQMV